MPRSRTRVRPMLRLDLWPEETRQNDGTVARSLVVDEPGKPRRALTYSFADSLLPYVGEDADSLVVGVAFLAMQRGRSARVHGQVSPSLLRNLEEFQAAWAAMVSGLTAVEITADQEVEAVRPSRRAGAVVPFSGGVDCCFTAYRHVRGAGVRWPRQIGAGVMIHGFDIPLSDREGFRLASERSRRILDSLNLPLLSVACNYKEMVADFPHSHGSAIASCLALFANGFSEGLIGQTFTYGEIRHIAEGVNALTDPMLSSDSFRVISDGAAFERADKIQALGHWKEFRENLRVCWAGSNKASNCCNCEKCIRNILTFRALGLGLPAAFEKDVPDLRLASVKMGEGIRPFIRYENLPRLAQANGTFGTWARILRWRLAEMRLRNRWPWVWRVTRRLWYLACRARARLGR